MKNKNKAIISGISSSLLEEISEKVSLYGTDSYELMLDKLDNKIRKDIASDNYDLSIERGEIGSVNLASLLACLSKVVMIIKDETKVCLVRMLNYDLMFGTKELGVYLRAVAANKIDGKLGVPSDRAIEDVISIANESMDKLFDELLECRVANEDDNSSDNKLGVDDYSLALGNVVESTVNDLGSRKGLSFNIIGAK